MTHPVADDALPDEPSTERATAAPADDLNEADDEDPTVVAARRWRPSGERTLLALLLVGAAIVRLVGPGQIEPNVSTAEIGHLGTIEALLAGRETGLLGWTDLGASVLALLPAALLRLLRPEPELALRLYAALGSLAFVGLFYLLCRTRFAPVVSLATTALLAFSPWSIFFGRNGELNAFVGCWARRGGPVARSGAPRRRPAPLGAGRRGGDGRAVLAPLGDLGAAGPGGPDRLARVRSTGRASPAC